MKKKILLTIALFFSIISASAGPAAAVAPPFTQIQGCGQTLAALNSPIMANIVAGATSYRFRVTTTFPESIVPVQTYTSNTRVFNLTQLSNFAFSRAYSIDVAVLHGGVWQPYGPACTIYSPSPTTQINSVSCGLTVGSIADPIYANSVPFAQGYRFRVTNLLDPTEVYIIDRNIREFRLYNFPVSSGATYLVEVAIKNYDGNYLSFGPVCSVTCPILYTKVQASFCGRTLSALSETIYADIVAGAQGYRFKVTNMTNVADVQFLDRNIRSFSMNMLANVQYNTPYKIEVSVKDPNGTYLPYGPFCILFTSMVPVPKIQLSQCELVAPPITEMMWADEYPNATQYRFQLTNLEQGYSQYITRTARWYSLNMFSGLLPNTAYTVRVAVKVDGVFTPYGKACDVTTPSFADRIADNIKTKDTDTSFMPKLYPNPYSEYFSIDALPSDAEVSVRIYDMTGRLLESRHAAGDALVSLELGRNFPPGVYNVILDQGDEVQTHRVIKR